MKKDSVVKQLRNRIKTLNGEFSQADFTGLGLTGPQISQGLHALCVKREEIVCVGTIKLGRLKPSHRYRANPVMTIIEPDIEHAHEPCLTGLPVILGIDPASIPRHAITVHRSR